MTYKSILFSCRDILLYSVGFFLVSFLFYRLMGSDIAWSELALRAPVVGVCVYAGVRFRKRWQRSKS